MIDKQTISALIDKLVKIGEDHGELSVWLDFWDALADDEQKKIHDNLTRELEALKKL